MVYNIHRQAMYPFEIGYFQFEMFYQREAYTTTNGKPKSNYIQFHLHILWIASYDGKINIGTRHVFIDLYGNNNFLSYNRAHLRK